MTANTVVNQSVFHFFKIRLCIYSKIIFPLLCRLFVLLFHLIRFMYVKGERLRESAPEAICITFRFLNCYSSVWTPVEVGKEVHMGNDRKNKWLGKYSIYNEYCIKLTWVLLEFWLLCRQNIPKRKIMLYREDKGIILILTFPLVCNWKRASRDIHRGLVLGPISQVWGHYD